MWHILAMPPTSTVESHAPPPLWRSRRFAVALGLGVLVVLGACSDDADPASGEAIDGQTDGADSGDGDPGSTDGDGTAAGGDDALAGRFAWRDADCEFAPPVTVNTSCGWLEVPERWDLTDDTEADTVELHVGIFSAGPNDEPPVVYLEGGPGGDPLTNIAVSFDQLFGGLAPDRDIIVVAQRGTGPSDPSLQCNEVLELDLELLDQDLSTDEEFDAAIGPYTECAERLDRADIDTEGYNSVASANDIEALRRALDHDTWDVFGLSYGTRLAQTLMRVHPEGIRSVILDSVLAIDRAPQSDTPQTAQRAYEVLFDGCAASTACNAAYPDFEERWFAMVDQLDAEPLTFETIDPLTAERYDVLVDGEDLMGLGFQALYSKSTFAALPEMIAQLENGDVAGLSSLVGIQIANAAFVSIGTYWSVVCHEETPFETSEDREAGVTGNERYDQLAPQPDFATFVDDICTAFDTGEAAPVEDELVQSDIPALVLAGSYDPVTPPADGEALLAGLSAATFVELPHTGHGAMVDECAQQIAAAFLSDPTAPVDTGCVDDVAEPAWAPDVFADVAFEPFSYESGIFSASGVAPVGWEAGPDGSFTRQDNLLTSSAVLQQVIDGEVADLLVDQLGMLGDEPELIDTFTLDSRIWSRYEIAVPGSIIDVYVAESDGTTLFVVLQHPPEVRDAAVDALVEPILTAIGP